MTDQRLHGARARFTPRAAAAGPARIRWSAPSSSRRRRGRRPGLSRARRRAARRGARAGRGRGAGARRDAVLHARAVLPPGPHRSVRQRGSSTRASRGSWRPRRGSESRWCAAAGFAFLRAHGVDGRGRAGRAAAVALNQPFFTLMRERRPFVILKAATSLDGCIAAAPGRRTRADVGTPPTATRTRSAPRSTRSASASGRFSPTIRC